VSAPRSTRITEAFAKAKREGRKALVLYLTASDPDRETSERLIVAAGKAGADVIEVGVPWSDPSADGPAIQAAMHRARAAGGGLTTSLAICRNVRRQMPSLPLVLFGYANPIFVRGPRAFAAAAQDAGADGLLCVDWPPDEASELTSELRAQGLDFIPLLAPTSTPARIRRIAAEASGFIYYVSLTGITGAKLVDLEAPRKHVAEIRELVNQRGTLKGSRPPAMGSGERSSPAPDAINALPIAVGFGVTTPADARAVASFADGVVVGTAAVRTIEAAVKAGRDPVPELEAFVSSLRAALGS
jgi:tryptophan synthase alpha chain